MLGQKVMILTTATSSSDRMQVLRFAASFVWADCEVADAERVFLTMLAAELGLEHGTAEVARLLDVPPAPEEVAYFRVVPEVVSVLDYTQGFAHTDLVTC